MIAFGMAEMVVVGLEMVDVDNRQPKWPVAAFTASPFILQDFVVTSAVGDLGQAVDHRQAFQQVLLVDRMQMVADPFAHDRRVKRFGDVVDGAEIQPALFIGRRVECRNEDDRDVPRFVVLFQGLNDLIATHFRHQHVEQNEVRLLFMRPL